jgi:hypothetical protein
MLLNVGTSLNRATLSPERAGGPVGTLAESRTIDRLEGLVSFSLPLVSNARFR